MSAERSTPEPVTMRRVLTTWWPLAGSWLLMGVEMPLFAIAVTRMPGDEIHLAAFGAVFPIAVLIEAPIIMLLAAATALVKDVASHSRLKTFAHVAGAALTVVHVLVAFTPVFDFVALDLLGLKALLLEPARLGMQIMTPWTWAIAYRRFQQGVLIRNGRSDTVVVGTVIRLLANSSVLITGVLVGTWPGIVVGSAGIAVGVLAEAVWAGWCYRRFAQPRLEAVSGAEPLTWSAFGRFYLPLAFTPIIGIVIQPIGVLAMNNMHEPVLSLAAWPAVYGLVFMTRSAGFAFNEVVVALAGQPNGVPALRRFGRRVALGATLILAALALTPLGDAWFGRVSGMSPELTTLASAALFWAILMPAYAVEQNFHQGLLVHGKRTGDITMAVALYLLICCVCLPIGVFAADGTPGIFVTLASFTVAGLAQTGWLAWRSGRLVHVAGAETAAR